MADLSIGDVDPGYGGEQPGAYGGFDRDGGGWGSTGNNIMDMIIGAMPGGWLLGAPDWLAQQHWGDGVAARGSSNDFTEGGGASTGFNDDARGIENIINELLNRQNPNPTTPAPTRVPRGGTEGGRRAGSGSMRSQYMPQYRGVSAGRNRQPVVDDRYNYQDEGGQGPMLPDDIAYAGGSKWFDESTGQRRPGAPPLGPNQKGYRGNRGSQYDPATGMESRDLIIRAGTNAGRLNNRNNIGQMALPERGDGSGNSVGSNGLPRVLSSFLPGLSSVQEGNNALTALSSFIPQANKAASDRSGQMTSYLDKLLQRGDIAEDGASINAAVSPRLQRGRNNALSSIMMGNRVSDNLYDMSNLGADIGGRQGAQNVNVRGRAPSRTRRF